MGGGVGVVLAYGSLVTAQRPNSPFPFLDWTLEDFGLDFELSIGLGLDDEFLRN